GKSTILRLIAGLETLSGGAIRIGGRDVTDLPPAQRSVSMVFQSYALFPHLNVEENIVFGLKVRRVNPAERKRRLNRAAELLGLRDLLRRKPAELSGGQRQRVALGRAIVSEAPVCLMDEPLSNLDAKLRHEMRREIRSLQQRLGITMIYVTHDQIEAMTMADKIVLLNAGRVEQIATAEELYARPATRFTAGFIGTPPMNLLPIRNLGDSAWFREQLGPKVPCGSPDSLIAGVRPEALHLGDIGVPAEVIGYEYLGADSLVTCKIGACECMVRQNGKVRLSPGDTVNISWQAAETHFFEIETGRRRE
ncbi:MAG TPA: ATP-binding cassette domain-containing protein, partial [Thermodesulfobacteriota bacterium]|nr:ATP-binding cassette domain-containing protein [Thermodesulfobacteriota bacterium]